MVAKSQFGVRGGKKHPSETSKLGVKTTILGVESVILGLKTRFLAISGRVVFSFGVKNRAGALAMGEIGGAGP